MTIKSDNEDILGGLFPEDSSLEIGTRMPTSSTDIPYLNSDSWLDGNINSNHGIGTHTDQVIEDQKKNK